MSVRAHLSAPQREIEIAIEISIRDSYFRESGETETIPVESGKFSDACKENSAGNRWLRYHRDGKNAVIATLAWYRDIDFF